MNLEHLKALAAVMDEGTFEAAADLLRITPSAVSQRIKALEASVGQVLVRRRVPCTATDAGALMLRMARQVQVLEAETSAALGAGSPARAHLPVAVNADSLATWFIPVLHQAAGWEDSALDLHVEDQGYSSQLLRDGAVMGAVTSDPVPVSGCRVELLGSMRYIPVAAPALRRRFSASGRVDWAAMPVLKFNTKDTLQQQLLTGKSVPGLPPTHTVPSSQGFLAAVTAGLGWGMIPELQLTGELADGVLVRLEEDTHQDVALYWQAWALDSDRLARLGAAVRTAAGTLLQPGGGGREANGPSRAGYRRRK
ncbi:LysR family transcriptional regulator ArgP [Pseudarthrobacter sp902506025]|uniref:LysR family transcriptional regulator (Chromosome initiation inhibitor) n=1 Tax=Pseudarthrobacter defluvii TaxID=410837 RepID=A0ABT9UN18_9MICC|nr:MULTISPECIES: LysR family transcriptional regulator ArgP [Micrococcaceae]MDQ0119649.1 LysR family transcriptional regulator (chromosome initiation inhibitor) [Pseudarthrobacter defluvii]BCW80951.1 lysine export transcriptional regulatory protein LysG [Arthrobacter sp. NicSoilC5]